VGVEVVGAVGVVREIVEISIVEGAAEEVADGGVERLDLGHDGVHGAAVWCFLRLLLGVRGAGFVVFESVCV